MFCWYLSIGANATSGYSRLGRIDIPSFLSGKYCNIHFHVDARQTYDGHSRMRVMVKQVIDNSTIEDLDTTYVESNKAYDFTTGMRANSMYRVQFYIAFGNAMSAELYLTMQYRDVTTSYSTESIITASKANELLTATGFASQYTISQGSNISKACYKAMLNACGGKSMVSETYPKLSDLAELTSYINNGGTITREFDWRQ